MIRLQRHGWLVVAVAGVGFFACAKGEQAGQSADSTARNLTLAPTESTATMKDVPVPADKAPPTTAQRKATPPKPAAPTSFKLAAGTGFALTADDSMTTRTAKAGDPFTATVSEDVKDASGHVVIPAGSSASR